MNSYTIQELEDLRLYLSTELQDYIKGKSLPVRFSEIQEALSNTYGHLSNYKNNPDIVYSKILEFASLSDAHRLILNLIYFYSLIDLISYIGTDYEPIVVWRYSVGKD